MIKKILQSTDPYNTILKNSLQKTLDAIIGKNQSTAIKKNRIILQSLTVLLTILLSAILDIIDVPNKLNKTFNRFYWEFRIFCFAKLWIRR